MPHPAAVGRRQVRHMVLLRCLYGACTVLCGVYAVYCGALSIRRTARRMVLVRCRNRTQRTVRPPLDARVWSKAVTWEFSSVQVVLARISLLF